MSPKKKNVQKAPETTAPKMQDVAPPTAETPPTAEAPRKSARVAGPTISPSGEKSFSQPDLQQLELVQLRASTAQQTLELRRAAIEKFTRDAQEKIRLANEELRSYATEYEAKARDLQAFYAEVEAVYGISMKEITYNTDTGKIQPLPPR